jgi:hypothetical protein
MAMKCELSPGEKLVVTFEGTDGEITVEFAMDGALVRVSADLPDSTGRKGVIYEERASRDEPCAAMETPVEGPYSLSARQLSQATGLYAANVPDEPISVFTLMHIRSMIDSVIKHADGASHEAPTKSMKKPT